MTEELKRPMVADEDELARLFDMDERKEKDGVVIQYGTLVVKIARMGGSNKAFAATFEEMTRPYRRMIENGVDLPEAVAEEIAYTCYAKCIVKGWNLTRKVEDATAEGGFRREDVPCTPENIIEQFKKRPEFFNFVVTESQRAANYRIKAIEDDSKNS